jgi:hypothetical protein
MMRLSALIVVLLVCFTWPSSAVQFLINPGNEFCIAFECDKRELAMGTFSLNSEQTKTPMTVDCVIKDPEARVSFEQRGDTSGKFAFTAQFDGEYEACFTNRGNMDAYLAFTSRSGVDAKDYDEVAKQENLKPIEVQLKRLEDAATSLRQEMDYLERREIKMKETNEATSNRIMIFSFMSMLTLVAITVGQIVYLKSFFKSKKLID